jgi:methionyl-tRNA formyltransferase
MNIVYVTRHFNHSGRLILDRLIREGFSLVGIVLHSDRNPWRNPVLRPLLKWWYLLTCRYYGCRPLKATRSEETLARKHRIPILWTDTMKSPAFLGRLRSRDPDILVMGGGWHELLPEPVFRLPRLGCINTHPSLLPEFRGTSITRWQLLRGVERSGTSIHYVDENFDTGGILAQESCSVGSDETPQELFEKLGHLGADAMVPLLRRFESEGAQSTRATSGNPAFCRYHGRWRWSEKRLAIDWGQDLRSIHFFVLANTQESYRYLGPIIRFRDRPFFLRRTQLLNKAAVPRLAESYTDDPEALVCVDRNEVGVSLHRRGEGRVLRLIQVQPFTRHYAFRRGAHAARHITLDVGDVYRE